MQSQIDIISNIIHSYDLCDSCTGRLISKILGKPSSKLLGKKYLEKFNKSSNKKCYICKNIFDNLDFMTNNIVEKSSNFTFKTFHLGIILKPSFLERDDFIKSKFKLQGIENLKFSISKELAKKISRKTKSKKIHDNSDIFIKANFKDESCTIEAKPLFIYGRYNKNTRTLPQKQQLCLNCNGIGCHNCEFNGVAKIQSIESKISNFLTKKFDCKQVKINWIGGEDETSLVLGNGRPFFAKLLNPKRRYHIIRKTIDLEDVHLSELKKLYIQPKGSVSFKSEVQITVKTEKPILIKSLKKLKILENTIIKNSRKQNIKKRIYTIDFTKISRSKFTLDLLIDGGIPIKSLIQNSTLEPNISDLIKNCCKCVEIDFKNILID